ncbi:MAG: nucleotidyltransferase domain-containing protein [Candidatus Nanoarchaeia archaeon]|nr:nucleotidyltransferase domain-containing protein [Candidatus Nanoarchaeia archaeon]
METKLKLIGILEEHKEGVHLRELSRMLETGLPNVARYIGLLKQENVVILQKEANLVKARLRESPRTVAYLKQVNTEKFLALPMTLQKAVGNFLQELETRPLIAVIFGSYAKGSFKQGSDIDILLVFQKVENEEGIENTAKRVSMRTNTKISPVYVDYNSFEHNFQDRQHGFSKEIRNKAIILLGAEHYYSLLWRFLA